jgi:hypothetical protein
MKVVFLALLLFASNTASFFKSGHIDFVSYNEQVNKAELCVVSANYAAADQFYDTAFSISQTPFGIDLQNALIVTLMLGKRDKAMMYANKLASLGVGSGYFVKKHVLTGLAEHPEWLGLLHRADSFKSGIRATNSGLIKKLATLEDACNQEEKVYQTSSRNYSDSRHFVKQIDSLATLLVRIFQKEGYPAEHVIGVKLVSDTILVEPGFAKIIFLSRMTPGDGGMETIYDDRFLPSLSEAMKSGIVASEFVYGIVPCKMGNEIKLPLLFRLNCSLYMASSQFSSDTDLNRTRKSLGLCDKSEYVKKARYNFIVPNNPFLIQPALPANYEQIPAQESKDAVIQRSTLIAKKDNCPD